MIASSETGNRSAVFAEADWRPFAQARLVAGVRTDRSSLTDQQTIDPRFSAAWKTFRGLTLTAAWGVYHQVPDPLYFDDSLSAGRDAASGSRQRVSASTPIQSIVA